MWFIDSVDHGLRPLAALISEEVEAHVTTTSVCVTHLLAPPVTHICSRTLLADQIFWFTAPGMNTEQVDFSELRDWLCAHSPREGQNGLASWADDLSPAASKQLQSLVQQNFGVNYWWIPFRILLTTT